MIYHSNFEIDDCSSNLGLFFVLVCGDGVHSKSSKVSVVDVDIHHYINKNAIKLAFNTVNNKRRGALESQVLMENVSTGHSKRSTM